MTDKEGLNPRIWIKKRFFQIRILIAGVIVLGILSMFFFPQVVLGSFNYLKNQWGDFQYQGGWYDFAKEQDDAVWYVHPGILQRDVVVPATVKYKGRTYRVEGVSSRVTVYNTQKENVVGIDAMGYLLKSFVISEGITSVPHGILMGATSVEYVEVPGTCKVLGDSSFVGCGNLREVVLREGIEVIETSAFVGAGRAGEALKVDIPDSVQSIGVTAFLDVELEQLKLPANLIEIENNAFKGASWREDSLKCTIPSKVKYIRIGGLGNTLTELTFEGTTPPDIQYDIPTVTKVTVPQGCLESYQTAYEGKFNENVVFIEVV